MDRNTEYRINELITELSECREDERNSQNQILEVISIVGTILGLLLGASYLNPESKNDTILIFENIEDMEPHIRELCNIINQNITYSRIMFWLSLLIFCTAFTYIVVLGINNVLRYYYIQNIEDRLHKLVLTAQDDEGRGLILHWNAFSAPIITKNIRHISSTHTALSFGCYILAIGCIILFSIGMVLSLFLQIEPRESFDYLVLLLVILGMILTFLLFLRLSSNGQEVAQFAWDEAHRNQQIRLEYENGILYGKTKSFKRILSYLIYPKKQDLQKPLLILMGFIYGAILQNFSVSVTELFRILIFLFIFDFLAYQARYQINDIRGLKEDMEAGCKNRLLTGDVNNPDHVIKISLGVAITKIIAALFLIIILGREYRRFLLICLGILLVSTIAYELARAKKCTWLIFVLVGIGYPLRFFVGLCSMISMQGKWLQAQTICFILALLAYGSFSSIMAWTAQVTRRMQEVRSESGQFPVSYEKKHFKYIQDLILDRFILAENCMINGKVMPMRESGNLKDPWNIMFLFSLILLSFIPVLCKAPFILLLLEIAACILSITSVYFKYKQKLPFYISGWVCLVGKFVIGIMIYKISVWYLLLTAMQLLIAGTYFILCYIPQVKQINFKEMIHEKLYIIKVKILGEYAAEMLKKDKK